MISRGQTPTNNIYQSAIRELWSEGLRASKWGIIGLYQGYIPTMLGIVPYAGTSFFVFESLKNFYIDKSSHQDIPQFLRLVMGMMAGVCAQTVTYPLDVIRRRSQLWQVAHHLPPSSSSSISETYLLGKSLLRSGGIKELFTGLSINYIKVAPSMGISFVVYDYLKENLF